MDDIYIKVKFGINLEKDKFGIESNKINENRN